MLLCDVVDYVLSSLSFDASPPADHDFEVCQGQLAAAWKREEDAADASGLGHCQEELANAERELNDAYSQMAQHSQSNQALDEKNANCGHQESVIADLTQQVSKLQQENDELKAALNGGD